MYARATSQCYDSGLGSFKSNTLFSFIESETLRSSEDSIFDNDCIISLPPQREDVILNEKLRLQRDCAKSNSRAMMGNMKANSLEEDSFGSSMEESFDQESLAANNYDAPTTITKNISSNDGPFGSYGAAGNSFESCSDEESEDYWMSESPKNSLEEDLTLRAVDGGAAYLSRDSFTDSLNGKIDGLRLRGETENIIRNNEADGNDNVAAMEKVGRLSRELASLTDTQQQQQLEQYLHRWFVPDEDGDTLLHRLLYQEKRNEAKIVAALAESTDQLDIKNKKMQTALHIAVLLDQVDIVALLLQRGCRIDSADSRGRTAFHLAVERGNLYTLAALLTLRGGNSLQDGNLADATLRGTLGDQLLFHQAKNQQDYSGLTPFYAAIRKQNKQMIALLMHMGVDSSVADATSGNTPLHEAVRLRDLELVQALLNYNNTSVNTRNFAGVSPLHMASALGLDDVAAVLVMHGASIQEVDDEGRSAMQLCSNAQVRDFLLSAQGAAAASVVY